MKEVLEKVFQTLDHRIDEENKERLETGAPRIAKAEITVLGQTSLLAQPELTHQLELAQTGDLDAQLKCDHFVKAELKKILPKYQPALASEEFPNLAERIVKEGVDLKYYE